MYEPDAEHLSEIVALINDKFDTNLTESDQLLFDQFGKDWIADPVLSSQAKDNNNDLQEDP